MKIVIAGSRNFDDYKFLEEQCNKIIFEELNLDAEEVIIISGTAKGADSLGEYYAKEYGMNCHRFPAEWKIYGRRAGIIRNLLMLEKANYVILFNMGTKGTAHMLQESIKRKVPYKHFLINE
jgi:hypothetical protein